MNSVVIINKNGDMADISVKKLDVDTLYKRAGFKQSAGFELKFSWVQNVSGMSCSINIFGKTFGREPQKNAFRFDADTVFFGNILLVGLDPQNSNSFVNIKCEDIDISMIPGLAKAAVPDKSDIPVVEISTPVHSPSPSVKRDIKERGNNLRAKVVSEPSKNYFDCSLELTEVAYV